ncbi:longevity assurance proteins LAG1/LAC1 [Ramicandelaber brevisporus]|nr:longevity assurance proteins LAG1/LAC1 [Ramicandelaber brevisporus]
MTTSQKQQQQQQQQQGQKISSRSAAASTAAPAAASNPPAAKARTLSQTEERAGLLRTLEEHQFELPLAAIAILWALYLLGVPGIDQFLFMSHGRYVVTQDSTIPQYLYGIGKGDIYFVIYLILVITAARGLAFVSLRWFAGTRFIKIRSASKRTRFAEQAWAALYYTFQFAYGVYLAYYSPYWFDVKHAFIGYPHNLHTFAFKLYYLTCTAFWLHMFFVIHVEKRRKDHNQMLVHHIATTGLLIGSYYTSYVRVGHIVQTLFDAADIWLSTAKVFRYAGFSTFCDILFGGFVLTWLITRHFMFGYVWYATAYLVDDYVPYNWDPENGSYYTVNTKRVFYVLFTALMVLIHWWFLLIVRLIRKVLSGKNVDDNRSDADDVDDEPEITADTIKRSKNE